MRDGGGCACLTVRRPNSTPGIKRNLRLPRPFTVVHAMDPMARRAGHRILSAFGRQTNWGEDPEGATHPLTLKRM